MNDIVNPQNTTPKNNWNDPLERILSLAKRNVKEAEQTLEIARQRMNWAITAKVDIETIIEGSRK